MVLPAIVLAAACLLIGFAGATVVKSMTPVISEVTGLSATIVAASLSQAAHSIALISYFGGALAGVAALLALARAIALAGRSVRTEVTWDCGYAQPSRRMQYTASSFAQPLTGIFALLLQTRQLLSAPRGLFPTEASLVTETPDPYQKYIFTPLFGRIGASLSLFRPLQQGQVQVYILYIAITLVALLLWQLA